MCRRGCLAVAVLFAGVLWTTQSLAYTLAEELPGGIPGKLDVSASMRTRYEIWNFFNPEASHGDNDYEYLGIRTRFGMTWSLDEHLSVVVEGQANGLIDMPFGADDPLLGPLGLGAVYRAQNRRASDGSVFVKQAYADIRDVLVEGIRFRGGRFEFAEGSEVPTGDPGMDWIQNFRISQRLIGPFGWSQVGRSFDGAMLQYGRDSFHTAVGYLKPTQGGFDLAANKSLKGLDVAYAAVQLVRPPFLENSTGRVFYIYYSDQRGLIPVDNRPSPVREAGGRNINHSTVGANWTYIQPTPVGPFDLMLWGVLQYGRWARQDHAAWAYAAEFGYRPASVPWDAWLRGGINRGSGDDDPNDSRHESFHQILPTARVYSLSTFYNLMNNQDIFAQLILKPLAGMVWRTDLHYVALTESNDGWYFGGGATENSRQAGFGYGARSSAGARSLLTVLETQLSYQWNEHLSTVLYYGHHFGNTVVRRLAEDDNADFGYLEFTLSL